MIHTHCGLIGLLSCTLLAGCSGWQSVSLGSDDPCASLQAVVADYPDGFASYRGKASSYNLLTVYRAKEQLVSGHCEIWAWDQTDAAYACNLNAPNAEVAEQRWQKTDQFVQQCLGADWERTEFSRERNGDAAGNGSRYAPPQGEPVVSVHSISRSGGPRTQRTTSLYIGSPARVDKLTE
ncbi:MULTISPECIES: hypothetical protein [Marinobacter]|uniref:hypothetical protein n=1 Tax=Marinobacter TaxID=2742 RepID=UPI000DAC5E11|nr:MULTISPECIES: hypothetical protein [Marinobacter]